MRFTKMQGTGNDFILVESEGLECDWAALARRMCDRHFGVGADGLILVSPSRRADVRMRIFNPDGSEAEMCGNGIRCLARYAVERGLARPQGGRLTVETAAGRLAVEVVGDGRGVRVCLGAPRFQPEAIPMAVEVPPPVMDYPLEIEGQRLRVTCLSMGNPHAVYFWAQPLERYPLEGVGPLVEHHPLFPQRVNFEVARVLGRGRMEVRVWERGAGPTLACGTGAAAAMVAAHLHHFVGNKVDITLPGGTLMLEWDGRGEVYLTGPAEYVFWGEWLESPQSEGGL